MLLGVRRHSGALIGLFLASMAFLFNAQVAIAVEHKSQIVDDKPHIVVTIRPLALLVQDIAGDLVNTKVLIDGSASPHDFSLTISQAVNLSDADLLIWVGPKFEVFLSKRFDGKKALSMMDELHDEGVHQANHTAQSGHGFKPSKLEIQKNNAHAHTHAGGHGIENFHAEHSDPHLWLNHYRLVDFARHITDELIELLPHQAGLLEKRLAHVLVALEIRRRAIKEAFAKYSNVPFAVHHDGYREFVEDYSLNQIVSLTRVPHERVSAKRLSKISEKISPAKCLLAEKAEERQAKRYANLFDKPLVDVDLLAVNRSVQSFDHYLQALAGSFIRCFDS